MRELLLAGPPAADCVDIPADSPHASRFCGPRFGATLRVVESGDSVLAARLAAGDDRALAEAVDAHGPAVHRAARAVLRDADAAQDVVQEIFVDLWCRPQQYDATRGSLRSYLAGCARHRAYDVLRAELRRAGREDRHVRLVPTPRPPAPGDDLEEAESASALREAVRRLPAEQREAVELAYFGGLSYRGVAQAIGIPEGTAKSRVRLALAKLETMLDRTLLEQP